MSEYQYYEFLAIDRPLDREEQADVRSLSTRARITATGFVNEYEWGDFRGNPGQLMEHYYDAHLYFANWGTRRLMLRLARDVLSPDLVEDYCVDESVNAWITGEYIVLDFSTEDYEGDFDLDVDPLPGIVGVRAELAAGDLRPLYLAWLASLTSGEDEPEVADDELEPPVPPGLAVLTGSQRALCDFLRVDKDLLHAAAQASAPLEETPDDDHLAPWLERLPVAEKNALLARVFRGEGARVQAELARRFRSERRTNRPGPDRRRVAELLARAADRREERRLRAMAEYAAEVERRERTRKLARERRLKELAATEEDAWAQAEEMMASRKPGEYDRAVNLLTDLQTIAEQGDRTGAFRTRVQALRTRHARKTSLIDRLNRAGL